ncbi:uncharacterized protein LOC102470279 [Tupaia chinensis]|uniref:uncharacterized protein LOC102470279 n=1 Tax=Tupaia chinensis TaxID=246437 RepID=UPI0003C8C5FB|nr:uncharacterized protein LOC102470279 [Tupaia chinensis]
MPGEAAEEDVVCYVGHEQRDDRALGGDVCDHNMGLNSELDLPVFFMPKKTGETLHDIGPDNDFMGRRIRILDITEHAVLPGKPDPQNMPGESAHSRQTDKGGGLSWSNQSSAPGERAPSAWEQTDRLRCERRRGCREDPVGPVEWIQLADPGRARGAAGPRRAHGGLSATSHSTLVTVVLGQSPRGRLEPAARCRVGTRLRSPQGACRRDSPVLPQAGGGRPARRLENRYRRGSLSSSGRLRGLSAAPRSSEPLPPRPSLAQACTDSDSGAPASPDMALECHQDCRRHNNEE